jgi:hypothetical protein
MAGTSDNTSLRVVVVTPRAAAGPDVTNCGSNRKEQDLNYKRCGQFPMWLEIKVTSASDAYHDEAL